MRVADNNWHIQFVSNNLVADNSRHDHHSYKNEEATCPNLQDISLKIALKTVGFETKLATDLD